MRIAITGDLFLEHPDTFQIGEDVQQLLCSCDYRIVNLEGPVFTADINNVPLKSGPRLKQPEGVVRILEGLGANMLSLANNHQMDYGVDGLLQTRTILRDRYTLAGCGTWNDAYKMYVIEKDGLKVGVLNFCEMQFGMLSDEWAQGENAIGCAWVNHPRVNLLILENKKKVDFLVAIVHAGVEMVDVPLPEWRDRYREMICLGCDAVIAHHPHVVQGYEEYRGKPIAYSLGNFCFVGDDSRNSKTWNTGAVAILNIDKEGVQFYTVGVKTVERSRLCVVPEEEWNNHINTLNSYLLGEKYLGRVNFFCQKLIDGYRNAFAMGGLFPADKHWPKHLARVIIRRYNAVHTLNNLQCESHRWCISRALKLEQPTIK